MNPSRSFGPMSAEPTIGEVLTYYLPRLQMDRSCPAWPPDLFGLMSVILELSGAYLSALRTWPPADIKLPDPRRLHPDLKQWRQDLNKPSRDPAALPQIVIVAWDRLIRRGWNTPIRSLTRTNKTEVACDCLKLLVIADSICSDLLSPSGGLSESQFNFVAMVQLVTNSEKFKISSIGREISPAKLTILPKRRTPQTGLSLRSLSLYLGAIRTSEIRAQLHVDLSTLLPLPDNPSRNLLLVPSPYKLTATNFVPVNAQVGDMANMNDKKFGFMTIDLDLDPAKEADRIMDLRSQALKQVKSIDAIVLPEAAMSDAVLNELLNRLATLQAPVALLAGLARPAITGHSAGENKLVWVPRLSISSDNQVFQHKHHRWQINRSQIVQYQLGSALAPELTWWEYIDLPPREIKFIQLSPWMTVAPLICEDLARPDPLSEILRAVGPDLVIALLMDGPQLQHRWAARNAMTLADDPGCAVLTFTCAGMVDLSNTRVPNARRIVALYKDPTSAAQEIELPNGAQGIILTLSRLPIDEWSADGRLSAPGKDFHPILSGVRYVGGTN